MTLAQLMALVAVHQEAHDFDDNGKKRQRKNGHDNHNSGDRRHYVSAESVESVIATLGKQRIING